MDLDNLIEEVEAALTEDDLSTAVEKLKKGLSRDPYWAAGHRLLGDIYLLGLDHPVYALVEYRKLKKVAEELTALDRLRLAWAYHQRSFHDRALETIQEIDADDLPEQKELIGRKIQPRLKLVRLRKKVEQEVEKKSGNYFDKYVRRGNEFLNVGSYYQAQQAFESALEYTNNSEVKLNLARCLVKRTKFPRAVKILKGLLDDEHVHDEARELLTAVYRRLGLPLSRLQAEREEKEDMDDSVKSA